MSKKWEKKKVDLKWFSVERGNLIGLAWFIAFISGTYSMIVYQRLHYGIAIYGIVLGIFTYVVLKYIDKQRAESESCNC